MRMLGKWVRAPFCENSKKLMIPPDVLSAAEKEVKSLLEKRNWKALVYAKYYAPASQSSFAALRLFDQELSAIIENSGDVVLSKERLNYWHGVFKQIYSGQPVNFAEPLATCLAHACYTHPLSWGYFTRIINSRMDQLETPIFSMLDMRRLADSSKSPLFALQVELLNEQLDTKQFQDMLGYAGQCVGIMHYVNRLPFFLRKSKLCPLPREVLLKYSVPSKIWNRVSGKPVQQLHDAVLEVSAYAYSMLYQAVKIYRKNQDKIPKQAYRAFLELVEIENGLEKLEKANFNIFNCQSQLLTPMNMPYTIFKAARKKQFWLNDDPDNLGLDLEEVSHPSPPKK